MSSAIKMSNQRPQLPLLDFQGLPPQSPRILISGTGSKARPITPSTVAQTARSGTKEPLTGGEEALSARQAPYSIQWPGWSASPRTADSSWEWEHPSFTPSPRFTTTRLKEDVGAGLATVPDVAALGDSTPSRETKTWQTSEKPVLHAYLKDVQFDPTSESKFLARKIPASTCGILPPAKRRGAMKPPTLEASFLKLQREDDQNMQQRIAGNSTRLFSPLLPGDSARVQREIASQTEHRSYYVGLAGKPQPCDSTMPRASAAPWQSEARYIPISVPATIGSTSLTVDSDACSGAPRFVDQLLGSHIEYEQAKYGSRIHGVMYEYASGLGRVQTVYCSNKEGVLYPLIILPKMTPFDIMRWKAFKKRKATRSWWNPRLCGCIDTLEMSNDNSEAL